MKDISKEFPESAIVLSTLREELTKPEIANTKKLVKHCKHRNQPVIILTKNELFSISHLSSNYKKLGGKFAKHADYNLDFDLFVLAEATQALYL
ncbi:hypothetical protein D3C86_2048420 [compost metagenome]